MGAAAFSSSSTTLFTFSPKSSSQKSPLSLPPPLLTLNNFPTIPYINNNNLLSLSYPIYCFSSSTNATTTAPSLSSTTTTTTEVSSSSSTYWIVVVKPPPQPSISKPQLINYYVQTLQRILGSEEDAQMCIYNASTDTHFGFCCDIDEETSRELASLPEVLSVRPDLDFNSSKKVYSYSNDLLHLSSLNNGGSPLFPAGNSKRWLVRVDTPAVGVITKAQVVDYYTEILANVLGNEKDAQMCMYQISWQSNYGFCCEIDDECAKELADVPGVLSVQPDQNVESDNKDYRGDRDSSATDPPTNIKTKKLFVTGLSFYTSEKTLRAAFEGFGELVEVKIIMDKISKRSKGFAFIEYTTEEAASAALKEMNGKIINGWMIVVDAAKPNPPKYSRGRPKPSI